MEKKITLDDLQQKINDLEEVIINGKKIQNLLDILAMDYFDKYISEDSLIVYNYKTFHEKYTSLLYVAIDELKKLIEIQQEKLNKVVRCKNEE